MKTNSKVSELIRAFPKELLELRDEQQRVSVTLYRLLARGEPVSSEAIATATSLDIDTVERILQHWPGVYRNSEGRIIGYWGLAIPKMSHRFEVNGRTLYTWCAWDTLFIPEILRQTAHVESRCPVTGELIQLTVTPTGVIGSNPPGVVLSFLTPEETRIRENVIENFCHYVHFFSSAQSGSKWISENAGTFLISIEEAQELAREKNRLQYGKSSTYVSIT